MDARSTNSVPKTMVLGGPLLPARSRRIANSAAVLAMSAAGWRTVVSGGWTMLIPRHIVEADNRDVAGHTLSLPIDRDQRRLGDHVVGGEDRCWSGRRTEQLGDLLDRVVAAMKGAGLDQFLPQRNAVRPQGASVTGEALSGGGDIELTGDDADL
jgi:hypothetical protein